MNSGREALEVELGVRPLQIRRQELAVREGAKILSKADQTLIKRSWLDWRDNIKTERFLSPFGKIELQLEDLQSETGATTHNIEPEFSYQESLQPSKRRPEYWDRLGSSKSRSTEQDIESRSIIQGPLDSCTPDSVIALQTDPVSLIQDHVVLDLVSLCLIRRIHFALKSQFLITAPFFLGN